jgi:hypothetical protein
LTRPSRFDSLRGVWEILTSALQSNTLIALVIAFFFTSAITVFDKRLIQAVKRGDIPQDEPMLPKWVNLIWWIHWGVGLALLIINWKFALIVFACKFILSVLPALETIGNLLMAPFKPRD